MAQTIQTGGRAILALAFTVGLTAACASAGAAPAPAEPPPSPPGQPDDPDERYRGVPGFDTREYPGDGIMARWLEHSPYRWVGYYLPAPCYTGTSWQGRREALQDMGWGTAVIYVGEQDWRAMSGAAALSDSAAVGRDCASANLTAERGAADARDATAGARDEGFAPGTTIYLDVERVDSVSAELREYVAAWTESLVERTAYRPGLYAHGRNAAELIELMEAAARRAGANVSPRLWVASADRFDVHAAPTESGFGAHVWQGAFDREERWGDVALTIDVNVAASRSPSH